MSLKSTCKKCGERVFVHWKTTLAGAVTAGCVAILPLAVNGKTSWEYISLAFLAATIGAVGKDFDEAQHADAP